MPAQSGDPVTAALHRSLAVVKKWGRSLPGGQARAEDIDSMLVASAKQVLLSEVKYEESKGYDGSTLSSLKKKYVVLSASSVPVPPPPPVSPCKRPLAPSPGCSGVSPPNNTTPQGQPATLPLPKRVLYPSEAVQVGYKNSTPIGSGFVNLGNTCYLNSTLQALFHVPAFVNWLLNDSAHASKCQQLNGMTHSECLICAMSKTLQSSHKCTGSSIKPVQIYSKLKSICKHLVHGHQEDAHEFLRYLMEGMEKSYLSIFNGLKLDTYSKETTPLNQIFGGYLRTEVTCLECEHVSTTFQHFQDLLLDIRQASSVEEALDSYFGRERLGDGDQAYKCDHCHKRVAATKKFSLERPPKALCVQLKRFGAMGGKNSKHITLKQFLDLSKYRSGASVKASDQPSSLRYKLVAMVTHLGPSASCGHYTAVGWTQHGSYYLFDDSVVRPLSLVNVLNTNAYILMYEQDSLLSQEPSAKPSIVTNGILNGAEVSPSRKPLVGTSSSVSGGSGVVGGRVVTLGVGVERKPLMTVAPTASPAPLPLPSAQAQSSSSDQLASRSPSLERRPRPLVGPSSSGASSKAPSPDRPAQANGSSPPVQANGRKRTGVGEGSASLVPYLSEDDGHSSDSETSPLTSPERDPTSPFAFAAQHHSPGKTPLKNGSTSYTGSVGGSVFHRPLEVLSTCRGPSPPTPRKVLQAPTLQPLGPSCAGEVVASRRGWEVTPDTSAQPSSRPQSPPANNVGGKGSGRWVVTSSAERDRYSSMSPVKASPHHHQQESLPNTNGKSWDGSRNSSTVEHLLKLSHRGYATGNISSWNGSRSDLSREVETERIQQLKRSHGNSYDDDLDRGKVKKLKKYHPYKDSGAPSRNRFQEFQNRKNSWMNGGGGGGRSNFYRNYAYDRSRHHGGYYNNRRGGGWRHH